MGDEGGRSRAGLPKGRAKRLDVLARPQNAELPSLAAERSRGFSFLACPLSSQILLFAALCAANHIPSGACRGQTRSTGTPTRKQRAVVRAAGKKTDRCDPQRKTRCSDESINQRTPRAFSGSLHDYRQIIGAGAHRMRNTRWIRFRTTPVYFLVPACKTARLCAGVRV